MTPMGFLDRVLVIIYPAGPEAYSGIPRY